MFSKIIAICAMVAVCHAGYLRHLSHGSRGHGVSSQSFQLDSSQKSYDFHDHHSAENAYPRYQYRYSVNDEVTRDQKSHRESRDGDNVEGEYSLLQPDGSTRTVTYTADKENGFQADVRTTGGNQYGHGHHFGDSHYHHFLH